MATAVLNKTFFHVLPHRAGNNNWIWLVKKDNEVITLAACDDKHKAIEQAMLFAEEDLSGAPKEIIVHKTNGTFERRESIY